MVAETKRWKVTASYSCYDGKTYTQDPDTPPDYRGICLLVDEHKLWFSPKDLTEVTDSISG